MNPKLLDLVERVAWTFAQALAGSFFAGGVAVAYGQWDWRAALTGAGAAAMLSVLKVLGVNLSAVRDIVGPVAPPAPDALEQWAADLKPAVDPVPTEPGGFPRAPRASVAPSAGEVAADGGFRSARSVQGL